MKEVAMMLRAIAVLLVLLVGSGGAFANPVAFDAMHIDFDPGNYVSRVDPEPYTTVDAYVMLEMFGSGVGFTTISFKLNVSPGTSLMTTYESLLPGGLSIGDWEDGITISSTNCIELWDQPAAIAVAHVLYLGTPGDVIIGDHPDYPRWVVDCYGGVAIYCVLWHGGIGKDAPFGDCEGQPVESTSWSAIKSLYR
jgi:hypothetical protein